MRFASFKKSIGLLALCSLFACGDDDDAQPAHDAHDAAVDSADAADASLPPLITALRAEVEQYDRRVRAICPCLVASGTYATEEECLKYALSGPDWAECAEKALADYDSAATRAASQCYTDFSVHIAECTEAAACDADKLAACGSLSSECLAKQNTRINLILVACPDFGLLSRLPTSSADSGENDRDD
jgi:hypothetical protein